MNKPKFIIGIGTQRAGSTLLHRILDQCAGVFMHPVKELHYFDTLFGVRNAEFLVKFSNNQMDRELDRLLNENDHGYIANKRYKCYLRTNWMLSRQPVDQIEYLDLYRPCIMGKEFIGEITPEYMILPDEGVKSMAETVGKDASIILLSRDPVERFISSFKLLKAYGGGVNVIENFDEELRQVIDKLPGWIEQQRQLSDYESALRNYRKYFDNVCFIQYEKLIVNDSKTIADIENCIGINIDQEKLGGVLSKKINQIGETGEVSLETLSILKDLFKAETTYHDSII